MALPEIHRLKPKDMGFVVHTDALDFPNGLIPAKVAARLRQGRGMPPAFTIVNTDAPWWKGEILVPEYHVANRIFVLILRGPELLNGKEWFYQIFFEEKKCWIPALKVLNVHPETQP